MSKKYKVVIFDYNKIYAIINMENKEHAEKFFGTCQAALSSILKNKKLISELDVAWHKACTLDDMNGYRCGLFMEKLYDVLEFTEDHGFPQVIRDIMREHPDRCFCLSVDLYEE